MLRGPEQVTEPLVAYLLALAPRAVEVGGGRLQHGVKIICGIFLSINYENDMYYFRKKIFLACVYTTE